MLHELGVRAFDVAWEWTYDREEEAAKRVYGTNVPCPGETCHAAHETPTPWCRLLVSLLRPLPPVRNECDALDRDVRWRFWRDVHTLAHNLSIRTGLNA